MEIAYKKDGNENYMIIKKHDVDESDYKFQMIINNNIEGIIPLKIKNINNEQELFYNTTSMLSVDNMFAKKGMNGEELFELIKSIKKLFDNMKEFFLDSGSILFDTDKIFIKRCTKKYMFCYCPQNESSVQENLRNLFDSLLEYVDHNDRKAVLIAYEIQRMTVNDDFTIQDLLECAERNIKDAQIEEQKVVLKTDFPINKIKYDTEEESKNNLLKKLSKLFRTKNKFKSEKELENEDTYTNNLSEYACVGGEINGYDAEEEDATMLLTGAGPIATITLRSINLEEQLAITPNTFPCVIGNSRKSSDFLVNNPVISRVHMRVLEETAGYYVEDLNSTNGTFVNDVRLIPHQPKEIVLGDKITLANVDFIVE